MKLADIATTTLNMVLKQRNDIADKLDELAPDSKEYVSLKKQMLKLNRQIDKLDPEGTHAFHYKAWIHSGRVRTRRDHLKLDD